MTCTCCGLMVTMYEGSDLGQFVASWLLQCNSFVGSIQLMTMLTVPCWV
jgi:hypothetical protein